VCCRMLQCVAVCCSVLQCVAVCVKERLHKETEVLQHVAMRCSVLQCAYKCVPMTCTLLMFATTASLCNTLQHTATHFNRKTLSADQPLKDLSIE